MKAAITAGDGEVQVVERPDPGFRAPRWSG
jgi:hypothetical protein